MLTLLIYCKDHKRRPIRFGASLPFRDIQGQIPAGWCSDCGCEIFEGMQERCRQCSEAKGENR